MMAFHMYADQHQGQFPTNFDQALAYLPAEYKLRTDIDPGQFEIVYQGPLSGMTNPQDMIVIRQREAWQAPDGSWRKVYGFADGHSQIHSEPDGNFERWEKQYLPAP
jgi:hypothetical protein